AQGHCILISSHIMTEVSALCDDLVVIANGRSVATGTPAELRARTGKENLEDVFVEILGKAIRRWPTSRYWC
ncbi:hypothetical protein ACFL12_09095, partial [Pseudomonadota bacterium]